MKKVVMVLYGNTARPLCIPTKHCHIMSGRVYDFLIALEGGCSIRIVQVQCAGSLGEAINSVITSKTDMRWCPHQRCDEGAIMGNGELIPYFLNNMGANRSWRGECKKC